MSQLPKDAYIVAYGRAGIAKAKKGSLRNTHPVEYGAKTLLKVFERIPQLEHEAIDDIVLGCAKPEFYQNYNIGRQIGLRAGLPYSVPGVTINRFCSSGLQAIAYASNAIACDQAEIMVAGGVENQTMIPMGTPEQYRDRWLMENEPGAYMSMGITAENVAARYGVTREDMDRFAYESHMKALAAQQSGKFDDEIVPLEIEAEDGSTFIFQKDECIRPTTTVEGLAELKPAFREDGLVTAGQSSQLSDSAAYVVLMNKEKMQKYGAKPHAKLVGFAVAGVDPTVMGIGPMAAVPKVLKLTGLTMAQMDIVELNEAFAAQAIPCIRELKMDPAKVNVNGGAIAMGHPMGATGAILTIKAMSELKRRGGKYGLITMCIGNGMGAAGIIEMC